jgi:NNP family nitrate/nitrite transporter-like MFS transporter
VRSADVRHVEARSQSVQAGAPMSDAERRHWVGAMSGALIGFAGSVGALGGVGINLALRESYRSTGTETPAFLIFLGFYLVCAALTWVAYVRRPVSAAGMSDPASTSAHTRG